MKVHNFKRKSDVYECGSKSSQPFQTNTCSNQSVSVSQSSTSGTNETYDKTRNTEVTTLQSNYKSQRESQQLPHSLPDATRPIDAITYHVLHPGNVSFGPTRVL
jgi:hypothetical protein